MSGIINPTVAILGATSHIAKSLIAEFLRHGGYNLHLYARAPERVQTFLEILPQGGWKQFNIKGNFQDITQNRYDVVINCVGVGTHNKLQGDYTRYLTVTEEFDNLVLSYLNKHNPEALYISFSSGAVYGRNFSEPVTEDSGNIIKVNHIDPADYYAIARLNAEAKHRSFKELNIVDLRIFSYFSRYIDLADGYFITDIMNSILKNTVLKTNQQNIVRDYIHPEDLFSILLCCMKTGKVNTAFDATSKGRVEKREILEYFSTHYSLNYVVTSSLGDNSPTGLKNVYCSSNPNAASIGYMPRYRSIDTIVQEAEYILSGKK